MRKRALAGALALVSLSATTWEVGAQAPALPTVARPSVPSINTGLLRPGTDRFAVRRQSQWHARIPCLERFGTRRTTLERRSPCRCSHGLEGWGARVPCGPRLPRFRIRNRSRNWRETKDLTLRRMGSDHP